MDKKKKKTTPLPSRQSTADTATSDSDTGKARAVKTSQASHSLPRKAKPLLATSPKQEKRSWLTLLVAGLAVTFGGAALWSFYMVAGELLTITRLEGRKESLEADIKMKKQVLLNLQSDLSKNFMKAKIADENATRMRSEMLIVASDLKRSLEDLMRNENKAKEVEGRYISYRFALEGAVKDLNTTTETRRVLSRTHQSLQAGIVESKANLARITGLMSGKSRVREELNKSIESNQSKLTELEVEVEKKEETLARIKAENNSLIHDINLLSEEKERLGKDKANLEEEIPVLRKKFKDLDEEVEKYKEEFTRLESDIRVLQERHPAWINAVERQRKIHNELLSEIDKLKKEKNKVLSIINSPPSANP